MAFLTPPRQWLVAGARAQPAGARSSVAPPAGQPGFKDPFHVRPPKGEDGVFTVSADSMSGDLTDPTSDRTVHVDRYTGKVLAEAVIKDCSTVAKVMAVGIALPQGDLGWWRRRPAGRGRMVAPGTPQNVVRWKTGASVMLGVALAFPLAGAALVGFLLLDALLLSRIPVLRRALS
ncbi:hypothetical protein [Hydrogenophaga sp. PAMC20947]|uniref:hypothetical protein n=1 Tax=Hydrogenophaga sp. PAMC20947 TaxID=2565558 RepID=UPI00109DF84E|nr:hypothetical protein [Hydrogenophaga sp. PAMC20947]QCB48273.1 hypothetical protein E5678_20935 [Hydrogenophaga sp. PAMC20947]